jgi:hypothetical protein
MLGQSGAAPRRRAYCPSGRADYIGSGIFRESMAAMIYLIAIFIPPLGLLLNGQPFAAILNLALIVPCLFLGMFLHVLLLVPSLHAVIAVHMKREERRHREIVEAIERHGAPPSWGR